MAHLTDYSTEVRHEAVVVSTTRLTPNGTDEIRELLLEVQDKEFSCQVDNSFGVLVEANGDFGHQHYHRLYSVADLPQKKNGKTLITMLVKRCAYVDDFSGERQDGVVSNYLCDLPENARLTITGPFDLPFKVPDDLTANLILIGMGTGIAPFRAFVKHIYKNVPGWKGKIRLFYGAKSGLELLYLNDKHGDMLQYYDQETFAAFHALSPRPEWADPIPLDQTLQERSEELIEMLKQSNTYVYVAGYEKVRYKLDKAFSVILGSEGKWRARQAELMAGNKWAEVIY